MCEQLYSLQNIMMFTPAAPSAGPTGGAGFAEPAASASLIILDTFFAITGSACLVLLTDRRALRLASALAPACKLVVWPTQENRTAPERRVLQSAMAAIAVVQFGLATRVFPFMAAAFTSGITSGTSLS